jgi:uracil-DNA glycosylase family 4
MERDNAEDRRRLSPGADGGIAVFRGAAGKPILPLSGARVNRIVSIITRIHQSPITLSSVCYVFDVLFSKHLADLMANRTRPQPAPPQQAGVIALNHDIVLCQRCPRLINHCRKVSATKRRAYLAWNYWGRPVPSFGDASARLLVLGLAPGAHGANRTGRMFTGDRSGDFLYRSLHKAGFASRPDSTHAGDGLELRDTWITASAHCAPPDNKPTPQELRACRPYLERELELLGNVRVVVTLGKIAFDTYLGVLKGRGAIQQLSDFRFGHGAFYDHLQPALLACYHPSQQNTSTGKLTQTMLDELFAQAARIIQTKP